MSWLFSKALIQAYESSHYSLEQEVDCSAGSSSGGPRSAQLSVMPTAHNFWRRGKTIEFSNLSLFGLTCAVLTESRGEELLTWFLEGFHARTSAQLEKGQALKASDQGYGRTWPGSSMKYDQSTRSWRTAQLSLLEGSEPFSGTWPAWGSMRGGEYFELPMLDSLIGGIEFGYSLPTPSGVNGGRNHTMGRVDEWGGSSNPLRGTVIGSMCLPEFEELVMGWPIGWTELTPYGTDKFLEWQRQHSPSCPPWSDAA